MTPIDPLADLSELTEHAHELGQSAVRHLWHHVWQPAEHQEEGPLFIVEGEGALLRDIHGREYIDGFARLATAAIGHGRSEMADAIAAQVRRLQYCNLSMGVSNVPATLLAAKLAEITPGDLDCTWFCNSGAEANETALKMARAYYKRIGQESRFKVIGRTNSYHGSTFGALSANGSASSRRQAEPLVPGFSFIPWPFCYRCDLDLAYPDCKLLCARMLEKEILAQGPDQVAAFIGEPIAVTSAVAVPPPEYWPIVRKICDQYGVLLIADEVLVGFGRTGKWFASEHWGLKPDIMTVAKGITSGYLPLSGAIATRRVADAFWGKEEDQFAHGCTYSGHPVSCVAGLTNISIMERERLPEHAAEMGVRMLEGLRALEDRPYIGHVMGLGLAAMVELVKDKATKERPPVQIDKFLRDELQHLGLFAYTYGSSVKFLPPLVITKDQVDRMVAIFAQVADKAAEEFHLG